MIRRLVVLVFLTSCTTKAPTSNASKESPSSVGTTIVNAPTADAPKEKVDAEAVVADRYTEGFNRLLQLETFFGNYVRVAAPVIRDKKFSAVSLDAMTQSPHEWVDETKKLFAEAAKIDVAGFSEIAQVANEAVRAADGFLTRYDEAVRYFRAQDYKSDQGKKAAELDADLSAKATQFGQALAPLHSGLSDIEDRRGRKALAPYAIDKRYGYWFRDFDLEAKAFLRAWEARDEAKILSTLKSLTAAQEGLEAFTKGEGEKVAGGWKPYVAGAQRFYDGAKRVSRAGATISASDRSSLIQDFNSLVGMHNDMIRWEAQGVFR